MAVRLENSSKLERLLHQSAGGDIEGQLQHRHQRLGAQRVLPAQRSQVPEGQLLVLSNVSAESVAALQLRSAIGRIEIKKPNSDLHRPGVISSLASQDSHLDARNETCEDRARLRQVQGSDRVRCD